MTDRAVSEVVSFVLVFALITSSVGVVTVAGLGNLQNARDAERINNGERAFEVLADNQRDILHGSAPSRATEIKLASTTLSLRKGSDSDVTLESGARVGGVESRPVTFDVSGDGTDIDHGVVYEMGAIIRVDRDGAVIRREPPFQFGENRTMINYVALQSQTGSAQQVSGSTTVLVRSQRGSSAVLAHEQPTGNVTLTIETDPQRAGAWKRYLETELEGMAATPGAPCDPLVGNGTVTCTFRTDELRVTRTSIRARIS
jgi:hypothetical protein